MKILKPLFWGFLASAVIFSLVWAGTIEMQISGPGAVNDSTIKVGEPVSMDIYIENDSLFTGFTFGFSLKSPDIKEVEHVADSSGGLNERGDIKGYNGWQDKSIWNFGGVYVIEKDWDGKMPELLGFGGLSVQRQYKPHELEKCLSFDLIFPSAGTVTVDSAFYPPGGRWLFATPKPGITQEPKWGGPYKFKVIK